MCQGTFILDTRENFYRKRVVKHWNGLPRKMVECLSLEVIKRCVDMVLKEVV